MTRGTKPPPGPLSEAIAAQLRAAKGEHRLSDQKIADVVSMSRGQVNEVLNATKHVDVEQLDRLCAAVGLDLVTVVRKADQTSSGRRIGSGVKSLVRK